MSRPLRTVLLTLVACGVLTACGDGEDAAAPTSSEPAVSYDGDWAGTMEGSGGEVSFRVNDDELDRFEAVIPNCDPGYTDDKAFTLEDFAIEDDGTVSSTAEDEYGGMGTTQLTLDGVFDGDAFTGTLLWDPGSDCDSGELAFSAERQ